jgi:hypothetical protein
MSYEDLVEELKGINEGLANINGTLLEIKVILRELGRLIYELRYR